MRAFGFLVLLVGAYLVMRWVLGQPKRSQVRIGVVLVGLFFIAMAASGRLPWILGLIGGLLPLLVGAHRARRPDGRVNEQASNGQHSVVETRFLRMELDHETGEMTGRVLEGRFAGQELHAIAYEQLLELTTLYLSEDPESAALLRAYLDRQHGAEQRDRRGTAPGYNGISGQMSRDEAYAILGLEEGASEEQVREAHRRLMQKLHPDRGGSTFLAAKINQAKVLLLNEEGQPS